MVQHYIASLLIILKEVLWVLPTKSLVKPYLLLKILASLSIEPFFKYTWKCYSSHHTQLKILVISEFLGWCYVIHAVLYFLHCK